MNINILIALIIFLPLVVSLFTSTAQNNSEIKKSSNASKVALLGLVSNILLIIALFSFVLNSSEAHLKWSWHFLPELELIFEADILSLLLILGCQTAVFVGILAIRKNSFHQKPLLFYTLIYLTFINGYFLSRDVLSFNIFYVGQIFPLFMMMGNVLQNTQYRRLFRLSLHYFLGAVLLMISCILTIQFSKGSVLLSHINEINAPEFILTLIWIGFFLAFILRLPIWPFHYVMTSVLENLKNPLVFIALHILSLSGIYGFMRFWPLDIPFEISVLAPLFQGLCILTMILAAFSGHSSVYHNRKLSNYIIIYDLLYLLTVFLPTDSIQMNLGYSAFSFLLLTSGLVILQAHMIDESDHAQVPVHGILCVMPRASVCYTLFILAAVGLPVSAFFWNNFIIVSEIFNFHLYVGTAVVLCITLSSVSLLEGLYTLRDKSCVFSSEVKMNDVDSLTFSFLIVLMLVLFLSLIEPLWFAF